jgi:demethylmenaquinone methyltransferase/2-methoxy-6-polyprenyl-1,4-benzoquinol methylase
MPGVFGLSVVEGARDRPGFPPTILITAFGDEETHETASQCGVVAVFDKPFEINDLLEKVRTSITTGERKRTEATELPYEQDVLRVFQSKQETKHFYNKIARVYDLLAEHSERPMREKGLDLLAAAPGETVLEVGFGTGHCLSGLARRVGPNGKVLGVDISENMLAEAKKTLDKDGFADRVELHCGDAEHLPYDSESIDGMYTSFTLELFDTPELPKVLAEWRRVLKPGGRLVVVAVSKRGGQRVIVKAFEWTHKHFPNLMDCRPIYVSRAMQAAGFKIQDVKDEQMWVPVEIVLGVKEAK